MEMVNFARCKCLGANVLRGPKQVPWDGKLEYDYQLWIECHDIVFDTGKFWQLCDRSCVTIFSCIPTCSDCFLFSFSIDSKVAQLPELTSIEHNVRVNPQLIVILQFTIPGYLLRTTENNAPKHLQRAKLTIEEVLN